MNSVTYHPRRVNTALFHEFHLATINLADSKEELQRIPLWWLIYLADQTSEVAQVGLVKILIKQEFLIEIQKD